MAAYTAVISLLQTLEQRNQKLFHGNAAETLDSLHATAEYFQKFVENASKSRFDTEKIKSLEEKIRVDVSYAEDVVEMKISRIIKVSRWTFGILQHKDLLPFVEKMDTTKKQVMEIVSHHAEQVLELSGDYLIGTSSTSYPMLSDKLEDDVVNGLDGDLQIIINRLIGRPRDLDVVTITGMGGIGKTTLARKAYHHLTIRYHFDILAWVTISQEFRCRNVFLEALHCISKQTDIVNTEDYDKMDDNELADLVQKNLKGRRYLVVVDDIWSRDVWDSIRGIFPNYNNGSRILLTTRENEVAMYANTCSPHEMSLLSLENGWRLLCDKVFGPKYEHPPELEEIGKEIVEKCQGLPLTISVIAGHLSKMARTLQGWKDVAQTLSEIIASHPDKCLRMLGLSYHHLPNCLKPCFLSMAGFREDFEVETWRLIQLWIAEGFIRTSKNGISMEEVAMDYLEDLISRNLIQARKRRFNGEIKACAMHDLLREFCLIEAEMTKHMHVERTYPTLPTQKHNVRRFSFQTEAYSVDDCCKVLPPVAKSILLFSRLNLPRKRPRIKLLGIILPIYHRNPIIYEFFSRFNLLRVLAIFSTYGYFESFPLVITKLFHLRYLQVPFHGNIPESISELQNLQTLICSRAVSLPGNIWIMNKLRYIRLDVPSYLPSLRTESILNLEEFSGLCCTSCTKEVFFGIPNLKRLTIYARKQIPDQLFDMSRLTKLEAFKFYGSIFLRDTIKRFCFPTSVRRLSLTWCCDFDWADISSTFTVLPNLEELKLKNFYSLSDEWRMSDEDKFKSLKLLLLSDSDLKCWEGSSDNFPNLKRLVLKDCCDLEEIPSDFGEICTLESIELHDCCASAEDSARNIEQEQEEIGNNILKVYIHNSRGKSSENGKSSEEVGIDYLEDLISRNLIQARIRRFNGEIKACGMHDLLREFCLIESEMTKFMHVQRNQPTLPTQKHDVRRFSLQTLSYSVDECCKVLPPVARSIHLFSPLNQPLKPRIKLLRILPIYRRNPIIHEFFSRFNLLRVLAIFNTDVWFMSFPLVITKLFHLRYLQIPFHGNIPESISELQNLQTLICRCDSSTTSPQKLWMMKNLRCIHLPGSNYLPIPSTESLQNLEEFLGLAYFSCTKEVFSGIPNLKRLIIRVPFIKEEFPHQLFDMSGLTKLEAFKSTGSIFLQQTIKRFGFPTSLKRLSLSWCHDFNWEDISSTLTMLPNLEELKLKHCQTLINEWKLSDEDKFKSLKFFLLGVRNLKCWEASSDNFPNLKRLILNKCYKLQEIPSDFGEICTLESIELHDCSATAEDSARNIEQEQEEMGNNSLKVYIHNSCGK